MRTHPIIPAFDSLTCIIDETFAEELRLIQQAIAALLHRLDSAVKQENRARKRTVYVLQLNALTSVVGGIETWRRGLILQTGVLLRNALETAATAAVVNASQEAWQSYDRGKFVSSRAIGKLKRLWPQMGSGVAKASGILSNEFTHVGQLYRSWQKISPTTLEEPQIIELKQMLYTIKTILLFLDLLGEATCFSHGQDRRYWVFKRAGVLSLQPTEAGMQWMKRLIGEENMFGDAIDVQKKGERTGQDHQT